MQIDYYAYEYSVIRRLMNIFKIESVCHEKEVEDIKGWVNENGKLENKTLSTIVLNDYIKLNFKLDWKYCFNTKIIVDAFDENVNIEDVVNVIKKEIEHDWLKEIKNDN